MEFLVSTHNRVITKRLNPFEDNVSSIGLIP